MFNTSRFNTRAAIDHKFHLLFDLPGSCFLRGFTIINLNAFPIKSAHGRLMSFKPEQLHEVSLCDDLTTASH